LKGAVHKKGEVRRGANHQHPRRRRGGRKSASCAGGTGSLARRFTRGARSTVAWRSPRCAA